MILDDLLEKRGLKFDDLTSEERETYLQMNEALSRGQLTLERLKEGIREMKEKVAEALVDEPEYLQVFIFRVRNTRNLYLKARLKNYLLLDALLSTPERAQREVERQLTAMVQK